MINPIRLCNDLFEDEKLSDSNLRTFAEDHLLRLSNNNPGAIYSNLITDTTTKFTAYFGKMSSEQLQSQIKEGLTVTKKDSRNAVEAKISSLQGLIKYKFGETSDVYQSFYPQGIDFYYKAKDGDLLTLLNAYQALANTHLNADFPADVTEYIALKTAFKEALAAQKNAFSLIDNLITGKNTDRKALTVQLTQNFLIIASNNIGNPDQFDDYFDPAYLPITDGPETFNGIINAGATISAVPENKITGSSNLLLENTGLIPLIFSLNNVPTSLSPNPEQQIAIQPGQRLRFTEGLPVLDKYYLIIQNTSPGENGKWHVEVS